MTDSYPTSPIRQANRGGLFTRSRAAAPSRGTVLFLHGLGESALCFQALLVDPRLAGWSRVAPDLPGYGKSPWPDRPLAFAETLHHLEAWVEALDLRAVTLVGHSMGGVLGAELIRRAPDRFEGFLNVEGNLTIEDCTLSADAAAYDVGPFLEGGYSKLLADVVAAGRTDPAHAGYGTSLRLCDPRQLHRDAVELVALSRANGLAADTAAAGCRTLYVLGDPRGTGEHSRVQLDRAGVRWQAIADAGHWPYIDQPDAFVDVVRTFLEAGAGGP